MRILLFFLLLFPAAALAASSSITGTYSSLYYNEEGGDLLGVEVIVERDKGGYRVKFQIAEGVPSDPVTVPAVVRGAELSFSIPRSGGGADHYSGKITKQGFLIFEGPDGIGLLIDATHSKPVLLKRKCSYWKPCSKSPSRK